MEQIDNVTTLMVWAMLGFCGTIATLMFAGYWLPRWKAWRAGLKKRPVYIHLLTTLDDPQGKDRLNHESEL